ncbi:MAG: SPFH domain-containing protein [Bacteroidota bacterium]|nr:hypothetical protein [Elusimicrobiota bacterium]
MARDEYDDERAGRSRGSADKDLVLAPGEYAYILDTTKGNVSVIVGPNKTSMSGTDATVLWNPGSRRFQKCNMEEAIQACPDAPEGYYMVLENPADLSSKEEHPKDGGSSTTVGLQTGRTVNIPGPVNFPLWPGQTAEVIEGHHLRSNQYLVVQVYNDESARENWGKAVIKPQTPTVEDEGTAEEPQGKKKAKSVTAPTPPLDEAPNFTMGKLLVIKGTAVSFYIPPTGIEVIKDSNEQYVRDAVTLERLEYCILLDEDGNKRYIKGPDVVFPKPTEIFVEKEGFRKFKAIELNEISGLYIKVIADYEEGDKKHKVGDELFVTGKDQMIYFPRPEHAVIKYGDQETQFAVAIPTGEGRYVLDRLTGEIRLQKGPCTLLPDPRKEVVVRRVIDPKQIALWFPGNTEAIQYNQQLASISKQKAEGIVTERDYGRASRRDDGVLLTRNAVVIDREETGRFVGDGFTRQNTFTPPRTITLDTKYEGAVSVDIWTGYAVLVTSKSSTRKVVTGPTTILLEYDESLESMWLSTGKPKSEATLKRTVYLRVKNNKVSDVIEAETKDLCTAKIMLSYRVNFEDDSSKWFDVENYVKFLTDHLRSKIRNKVKQYGIEEFYANSINIIRDTILGIAAKDEKRPGCSFEENGMKVYDVEVLSVDIGDNRIADMLIDAQHDAVNQAIKIGKEHKQLEVTQRHEEIMQKTASLKSETIKRQNMLSIEEIQKRLEQSVAEIEADTEAAQKRLDGKLVAEEKEKTIEDARLLREKARSDQELTIAKAKQDQRLAELQANTKAVVDQVKAIEPNMVAALQTIGDKMLTLEMTRSMSPLAILGGKSVADVVSQLLKGTVLENVLKRRSQDEDEDLE